MIKNSKFIILAIILLIVVFISIFLIYVHNTDWIQRDFYLESTEINAKMEVVSEFKQYNSIVRSNLFLFITNDESFYSGDSIQLKLKKSEFKLDSLISSNDLFLKGTLQNHLIEITDNLKNLKSKILEEYYSGDLALSRKIFIESYNPLFLKSDKLSSDLILSYSNQMVSLNSDAQAVKQMMMRSIIIILLILIVAFCSIYVIIGIVERKRAAQQSEINKLKMQQEINETILHEQRRLNAAIMAAGFGVLDWRIDNQKIEVNDRWLELMDISRRDFNKSGMDMVLGKINNPRMKSITEMLEMLKYSDKSEFRNELEIEHSNNKKYWVESIDYIIQRDSSGKPVHIIGFLHDITIKKHYEFKLRESFNIVKLSGRHGKIGYWEFDISKSKPDVSDEWLELFSISRDEYNSSEYSDWIKQINEDFSELAVKNHKEISSGAVSTFQTEYLYNHPSRGEIWIEGMGHVTEYNNKGRVKKYVGYHQDITSRKQNEIRALKNASELKSWYENMNMAFCVCSIIFNSDSKVIDYKFVFVNNEFCNLLNLSAENLIGQSTSSLLYGDLNRIVISKIENIISSEAIKFELYEGFLDKKMEISAFNIGDNKFAMLFSDITKRHKLEQKLVAEQAYYRSLFEMSRDAIFLINVNDLSFIDANEASLELFGAQRKQDLLMINYLLLHPAMQKNGQLTKTVIRYALKNAQSTSGEDYEMIFRKITGQEFIGQIKFSLVDYKNSKAVLGLVRDVTKVHDTMENMERMHSWLQTIIDSVNSVIVVKDNYGKIMACNHTYNKTFGYLEGSAIGSYAGDIYSPIDARAIKAIDDEIILLGLGRTYEQKLNTSDGKQHIFLITKTPLKDSQQNVYAIVAHGTDITTIKNLEDKLRVATQKAVLANKAKSGFLANMSHEIRTPMNAIIGFAEILHRKISISEQKEHVRSIISAGNTLLSLINDILDLSKIEAGKTELKPVYFKPESLQTAILDIFKSKAEEKQLSLVFNIIGDENILLFLDENRLRQVLINIVGNAIKFTSEGYVRTELKVGRNGDLCDIEISVADSGPGIPKDELKNIFNPFTQSENIDTAEYGGTGLGLSISKQLISLMNGDIEILSELGKGSSFLIKIPDVRFEFSNSVNDSIVSVYKEYVFAPAKILITDDIKSNIDVLVNHLSDYNFEIYSALSGNETIERISEIRPDILILDIRLPDIGGREVAAYLRNMPELETLKIIAYTAASGVVSENGVLNSEFDAIILKPATREVILNEIKKFVAYEEITNEEVEQSDIFKFNETASQLIAGCIYEVAGIPEKKLTNRQISLIIGKIKEADLFLIDEELQRFISIFLRAVEDFNVIIIEKLSTELINQFSRNKHMF